MAGPSSSSFVRKNIICGVCSRHTFAQKQLALIPRSWKPRRFSSSNNSYSDGEDDLRRRTAPTRLGLSAILWKSSPVEQTHSSSSSSGGGGAQQFCRRYSQDRTDEGSMSLETNRQPRTTTSLQTTTELLRNWSVFTSDIPLKQQVRAADSADDAFEPALVDQLLMAKEPTHKVNTDSGMDANPDAPIDTSRGRAGESKKTAIALGAICYNFLFPLWQSSPRSFRSTEREEKQAEPQCDGEIPTTCATSRV